MQTDEVLVPGAVARFDRRTLYPHERAAIDTAFARILAPTPIRVLDMGCGRGRTTAVLVGEYHATVEAFDIDPAIVEDARRAHPGIDFRVGDATRLEGHPDGAWDMVLFSFNGIDYISTREARLACYAEAARVLRPGGAFVYSSHNRRALLANKDSRRILRHNLRRVMTGEDHLWEKGRLWNLLCWHGSPKSEAAMLDQAGFDLVATWSRRGDGVGDGFAATAKEHWPYYVAIKR